MCQEPPNPIITKSKKKCKGEAILTGGGAKLPKLITTNNKWKDFVNPISGGGGVFFCNPSIFISLLISSNDWLTIRKWGGAMLSKHITITCDNRNGKE